MVCFHLGLLCSWIVLFFSLPSNRVLEPMTRHLFASLWRDQRKIYWTSETNLQNYITAHWPSLYRWVVLFLLFVSLFARFSCARIHSPVQSQSEVLRKIPKDAFLVVTVPFAGTLGILRFVILQCCDHRAAVYSVFSEVLNSFLNYHFQLGHVLQVRSWLCMTEWDSLHTKLFH